MAETREPAVVRGWAAKAPSGNLVADAVSSRYPNLHPFDAEKGWTIVPVEIRELPPEQHEEKE